MMEIKKTKLKLCLCCLALLPCLLPVRAQGQAAAPAPDDARGWYLGIEGGIPFGVSTFSSFGADKTRAGYAAGLFGGYRFNPVLSLEGVAKWGKTSLSARECCLEHGYWLGADGARYYAPVAGLEGWDYSDLKSSVRTQRYGLRLNVNLLGLFNATRYSRWRVELSPELSAAGTRATVKTIASEAEVMKAATRWHLGAGGNLQIGFRVSDRFDLGLYSGVTYLSGRRMDGLPEYRHKANFLWESGLRLGFTLGGKKKGTQSAAPAPATTPPTPAVRPEDTTTPAVLPDTTGTPDIKKDDNKPAAPREEKAETVAAGEETTKVSLPVVYFRFDSTKIPDEELPKLDRMAELLQADPTMNVTVTGWCDTAGSREVNARYSLLRAEAVKAALVRRGIAAERIRTQGNGSDRTLPAAEARRAETADQTPSGKEETK